MHICVGINNGCNAPGIFTVSPLFLWQVLQVATESWMSIFMPFQKNEHLAHSYVL
jgi:hypothetical protein